MNAQLDRRQFVTAAALGLAASHCAGAQAGDKDCPTCRGVGLIPLEKRAPYVWAEGQPAPKPELAVRGAPCPECSPKVEPATLVEFEQERLKTALDSHKLWEERTGWKLLHIETRHATLHTLVPAMEAAKFGPALEELAAYLQKLTGRLLLTPTTPESYELFALWEKRNYEHFRTVLEKHFGADELGPSWAQTRDVAGYDFGPAPFFYEDPATAKVRPPVHGVLFMAGRRLINVATSYASPTWLTEGFAAYCERAVMKRNRWSAIYDPTQGAGNSDWLFEVRRLGVSGKLRSLADLFGLELRDFVASDYVHAFGAVMFLLESDPKRFQDFVQYLHRGRSALGALEDATEVSVEQLEKPWAKWLRKRA